MALPPHLTLFKNKICDFSSQLLTPIFFAEFQASGEGLQRLPGGHQAVLVRNGQLLLPEVVEKGLQGEGGISFWSRLSSTPWKSVKALNPAPYLTQFQNETLKEQYSSLARITVPT